MNDPDRAAALPAARAALAALVPRLARVAVVSGRPVEFLRERLDVEGVTLVGQYGLERLVDGEVVVDARARPYVDAVAAAAAEAESTWPELLVERKGELAFTVHWRTAPGHEPHPGALESLARRHALELQPGRMACELRTPVAVDKGTAVAELFFENRGPPIAFAGDDRGDLSVFDFLDSVDPHEEEGPGPFVRIAVRSSEAPPELIERADVVVDGPEGLARFLADLSRALPPRPG